VKKSDIDNFENYLDSYLKLLRKKRERKMNSSNKPNTYSKKKINKIGNNTVKFNITLSKANNNSHNTHSIEYKEQININYKNKTFNTPVNKTHLHIKDIHSTNFHIQHQGINDLPFNLSDTKINNTQHNTTTNISSLSFNSSLVIDNFLLNNSIIDENKDLINIDDDTIKPKHEYTLINQTNYVKTLDTAKVLINENKTTHLHHKSINHTHKNKTEINDNNNETIHKKYINSSILTLPGKRLKPDIIIGEKIINNLKENKTVDEIYINLKTKSLNEDFDRRESDTEFHKKEKVFLEAENIEHNVYKRIVNIAISIIVIGLLMGIFLGLILVMYLNSKK
jgi:hypothetical protein